MRAVRRERSHQAPLSRFAAQALSSAKPLPWEIKKLTTRSTRKPTMKYCGRPYTPPPADHPKGPAAEEGWAEWLQQQAGGGVALR